jgi:iron complex outermembrane receptor protein
MNGEPPTVCVPYLQLVDVDESELFGATTPMASLALRAPEEVLEPAPIEHLMGYFTYSRGFKSGGFNGMVRTEGTDDLSAFQPEFLDSFEIGIKTISLDSRLTFNVALFKGNYTDQQVQSVVLGPPLIPGGPPQVSLAVTNAAESKTQGLEIEAIALPFEGFTLQGNVGLLDSQFINYLAPSDLDGGEINRAGQRFPYVPELQTHLALQYSFPIEFEGPGWLQGWLTPRLDWYYQSAVDYAGPELPQAKQTGYNLLHARVSFDFDDDRTQVALWAKNLTDQEYFQQITGSAATFGQIVRFYQPPRTFGAELSYRF